MAPAIVVECLVKAYGGTAAVDGLSFTVDRGEIFALLGPNGAGKTTTVEILEGYRSRDGGRVEVLGLDPERQGRDLRPRIGVMLQEGGLYPAITPREALDLFAHFYPHARRADDLLHMVGLEDSAGTRYRRLSGGLKQRLALALALVGYPDLIFLDEPTVGLDPHARRATWETIGRLREEGATILLTTHYLEEAERLADRVAIINRGKLVAAGRPSSLLQSDVSVVRLRSASHVDPDIFAALPSVRSAREVEPCVYLLDTGDAPSLLVEVTVRLREEGVPVLELRVGPGSLEEAFLQLTAQESAQ